MFMDGSYIHYTYDAAGTLLRKGYFVNEELTEIPGDDEEELTGFCLPDTHLMSVGDEEEEEELVEEEEEIPYTDVTDYCGNCVYENGTLKTILIEDGYVTFDSNSQPVYHFYLKDHLGNNRVVANASGQVEQVNHYYPYGGLMAESTGGDVQRYKYNGKELDRMLGLDWFDYGARHYDGALTMWGTVDPLCEKNPDVTPYHYCHNNPFNRVDPDGKDDFFNEKGEFLRRTNAGSAVKIKCGNLYKDIIEVNFSNKNSVIENIGRHYLAKADKGSFNLSVSSIGNGVPIDAAFSYTAGTQNYDIYLTNGYVNRALNNCYNFECITFHESTHRYDSSTLGGTIGEVNAIMRTAYECPAWNNASLDFIQTQASYAAQKLNSYVREKNIPVPQNAIQNLNGAFVG